jgi:hypothetical protein
VKRIFPILTAVIAIASGVIVLLGYFVSPSQDNPYITGLAEFRNLMLQWSVLVAGIAVMIGVGNLFSVHLQKITEEKPGALYSVFLLVFFLLTFVLVVVANYSRSQALIDIQDIFLNGIMIPVEISLVALLAITLIYSAIRMLRSRIDLKTIVFLFTALFVLISAGPLTAQIPMVGDVIGTFMQSLSTGGARGILIGVALGTLTTGLRILLGADRPYGGK